MKMTVKGGAGGLKHGQILSPIGHGPYMLIWFKRRYMLVDMMFMFGQFVCNFLGKIWKTDTKTQNELEKIPINSLSVNFGTKYAN